MLKKPIYRIDLEDYSWPRFASRTKAYLGNREEIMELMSHLSADPYCSIRYAETIEAVDRYDLEPEATHFVAGQERQVLTVVEPLVHEILVYDNADWLHNCDSQAKIRARADRMTVEQVLVLSGEQLIRCGKFNFEGLQICLPGVGWICPNSVMRGFPGVMECTPDGFRSKLYSELEVYPESELCRAIQNTRGFQKLNYDLLLDDILGEL